MPGAAEPAAQLYYRLIQMHNQIFDAERFEVAYHILAAALHAAEETNNVELLTQVETLAIKRQAEIDRNRPDHKVSSSSAHGRGNFALFIALSTTAGAARGRIVADQAVARARADAGETP